MARPRKIRIVGPVVGRRYYKPQGIPLRDLDETVVTIDALEAMRLADVEGLDQREAARRMGVSPATVSRLLAEGRRTVTEALSRGWALRIEGGPVETVRQTCRLFGEVDAAADGPATSMDRESGRDRVSDVSED